MKRRFTIITAALALLAMMVLPGKVWADDVTATLTGSAMVVSGSPSTGYTDYTSNGITDDDGNIWYGRWCYQKTGNSYYQMVQIRTYSNNTDNGNCSRLNVPTFDGTLKTITLSITDASSTSYNNGTGTSATLYLATAYSKQSVTAIITESSNSNRKSVTFDLTQLEDDYSGEGLYILANGSIRIWSVVVVYTPSGGGGSQATATTTTIDYSGITNTNLYNGTAAGSLSATVTPEGGSALANPTIIWSSSNTGVATIADGTVTLVAAGTTIITASYEGDATYGGSSATYELTVTNDNPNLVTIWSENFSSYSANAVPSGGTYGYVCTNGGGTTKIYTDASTGGESPELLVGKSNGTFTATIPLLTPTYGYDGDLTLKYKTNAKSLNVKTTTSGITIEGESEGAGLTFNTLGEHTIIIKGVTTSTENITIVFTATTGDNVRLDDIVLKGVQAALSIVATPEISPASGVVVSGTEVTITCLTDGASIYYTMGTNPADPTSNSTQYNPASKPTITETTTIKAIAVKNGLTNSGVASATYTIAEPCATPAFSVDAGEVDKGTTVEISTATAGATIYYTTNGIDPTASSSVYSSALTINTAQTIKAIAVKDGLANSEVASATYTIKDYATMPFTYDGNGKENPLPTGLSQNGLGSAYSSSPKMKFDDTDDYLILKLGEAPVSISYDILGNSFSGGTFKVQLSEDGSSYTDLATYTTLGSTKQSITHICNNSDVRYIRWIYTYKKTGNVALGNIKVTNSATINNLTITSTTTYIVESGAVLTLTGTATNNGTLIIEDGGQLIASNVVAATVVKSIANWTTTDWYFISSPIGGVAPSSVTGMITDTYTGDDNAQRTYDLYSLDITKEHGWQNYRQHGFSLVNGMGYLYASKEGTTLNFTGNIQPSNDDVTVSDLNDGFNLVGNPFTCDAYVNLPHYTLSQAADGITSTTTATANTTAIAPLTGVVISGTSATFSKNVPDGSINNGNVQMVLSQTVTTRGESSSQTLDNAIVSFNEGNQLEKFYFGTQNANLYIPQNNEEYAIVSTEAQGEMPVSFRANENGQYTLTVNAENVEMNYLHLIDNMTGADIDLLQTPSYTFNATTSDYTSRFRLVFSANNSPAENGNETFAYYNGSEWMISNMGEATLQVVDVMGRVLSTKTVNGNATINLNQTPGVYMFRLINGDSVKVQKVVVR